jgi:hypothetical protein
MPSREAAMPQFVPTTALGATALLSLLAGCSLGLAPIDTKDADTGLGYDPIGSGGGANGGGDGGVDTGLNGGDGSGSGSAGGGSSGGGSSGGSGSSGGGSSGGGSSGGGSSGGGTTGGGSSGGGSSGGGSSGGGTTGGGGGTGVWSGYKSIAVADFFGYLCDSTWSTVGTESGACPYCDFTFSISATPSADLCGFGALNYQLGFEADYDGYTDRLLIGYAGSWYPYTSATLSGSTLTYAPYFVDYGTYYGLPYYFYGYSVATVTGI